MLFILIFSFMFALVGMCAETVIYCRNAVQFARRRREAILREKFPLLYQGR